jgi:hypothetical protein
MSETEQLYGQEGIEASQGWSPMPLADAAPAVSEQDELDAALNKFAEARPDEKPVVERAFFDTQTGEPRPAKETVSAEDAARQLTNTRQIEADAEFEQRRQRTIEALDNVTRNLETQAQGETPAPAEAQPQPIETQEQPPQPQSRLGQLLQSDPELLSSVQELAQQVRTAAQQEAAQKMQQTEAALAAASQFAKENAQLAMAALFSEPELQGATVETLPAVIQTVASFNKQRAAELVGEVNHLKALAVASIQAQQGQAAHQQRQFQAWAKTQDDAFDQSIGSIIDIPPATLRTQATETMRAAGLTDADLYHQWQTNPLMRSAAGQIVMAKAAAFDHLMAQQKARKVEIAQRKVPPPVPPVVRPGVSEPAPDYSEASAIQGRFNLNPSKELGAALIAARRAARSR